jgi:hypothetical protein
MMMVGFGLRWAVKPRSVGSLARRDGTDDAGFGEIVFLNDASFPKWPANGSTHQRKAANTIHSAPVAIVAFALRADGKILDPVGFEANRTSLPPAEKGIVPFHPAHFFEAG